MKLINVLGLWLRYKDSARPIETIERIVYAFNNETRECLVSNKKHVAELLSGGRYEVSGVEVEDARPQRVSDNPDPATTGETIQTPEDEEESEPRIWDKNTFSKKRGRPRKVTR